MISFIAMLFPCIFGVRIYKVLSEEKNNRELIIVYLRLVLVTNAIMFFVVYLFNSYDGNIVSYINEHSFFAFKYIVLLLVVNFFVSIIMSVFKRGFYFELENIKKSEKKITKKVVKKVKKSN